MADRQGTDFDGTVPQTPGAIVALTLEPRDEADLRAAVALLESPGLVARLSDLAGTPVEAVLDRLPTGAGSKIDLVARRALEGALSVAVTTMGRAPKKTKRPRNRLHTLAAGVAGAAGGAFGLASLAVELPVTTALILRSVADIARSEGEDLRSVSARLSCLEVFAIGGRSSLDDASESGYFAVRAALARAVSEASRYIAQRATVAEGAPVIAQLLARIGARFNTVVAEKIVAQGVPVVGALGGAAVNMMFIRHFQDMARGHFVVRRLERSYGEALIREQYDRIRAESTR